MKGYATLPDDVVADDAALDGWIRGPSRSARRCPEEPK